MNTHNLDRNIYRLRIFSKANVICKIGSLCLAFAISLSNGIAATTTSNETKKESVDQFITLLKSYNFETKKFEHDNKSYEGHVIVNFFKNDKYNNIRTDFIMAILNDKELGLKHLKLISNADSFNTTLQECLPTPNDIFKYKSKLYSKEDGTDLREHILDATSRKKGFYDEYDYFVKHVKDASQWDAIVDLIPTWITIQELGNSLKADKEKVLSFITTHIGKIAQNNNVNKKAEHEHKKSIGRLITELLERGEYSAVYSFNENKGISEKIQGINGKFSGSPQLMTALQKEVDENPESLAAFLTAALSREHLGEFADNLAKNGFYKSAIFVFDRTDAMISDPYFNQHYLAKIIDKKEGKDLVFAMLSRAKQQGTDELNKVKDGLEKLLEKEVTENGNYSEILSEIFKKVNAGKVPPLNDAGTGAQNSGFLTVNSFIGLSFILICSLIGITIKFQLFKKKKMKKMSSSN